jgi:predicted ATPase
MDMTKPVAARATGPSIIPGAEVMGGELSEALRASWLPKITKLVLRAESFFTIASYLDDAAPKLASAGQTSSRIRTARDFCASSRNAARSRASSSSTNRNPALSPARLMEFLKLLRRMGAVHDLSGRHGHRTLRCLMAYPNATLCGCRITP